MKKYLRIQGR